MLEGFILDHSLTRITLYIHEPWSILLVCHSLWWFKFVFRPKWKFYLMMFHNHNRHPESLRLATKVAFESRAHFCPCGDMAAVTSIVRPKQWFILSFEPFDDPGCRFHWVAKYNV